MFLISIVSREIVVFRFATDFGSSRKVVTVLCHFCTEMFEKVKACNVKNWSIYFLIFFRSLNYGTHIILIFIENSSFLFSLESKVFAQYQDKICFLPCSKYLVFRKLSLRYNFLWFNWLYNYFNDKFVYRVSEYLVKWVEDGLMPVLFICNNIDCICLV